MLSQSSWQIGRPDLNAFFFWTFFFPEQQTCQIWVGHSFEIWNLIFGRARYKTEHRVEEVCCSKCFIVFVISFLVYFDKKVHKKLKKEIKQAKNISNLGFCWIKRAPKNKCARQLWHMIYFFQPYYSNFKRVFAICMETPNTNGKKKEKRKRWFQFKNTPLNPHCTSEILKSNPHRLNLPLHPFTPPPHTHSAEQNCQGGQTYPASPGVGIPECWSKVYV